MMTFTEPEAVEEPSLRLWRCGGLMVCALIPRSTGPSSSPGQGHCVVFLDKTLNSYRNRELLGKPNKLWGVTCDGLASHPGGVEILQAASCYRNRDKLKV